MQDIRCEAFNEAFIYVDTFFHLTVDILMASRRENK